MALFQSKEEKQEEKRQQEEELLEKYGLDQLADPEEREIAHQITKQMTLNGMANVGAALGGVAYPQAQMFLQQTIVQQNFLIIHELNRMNKILSVLDKE